MSTSDLEQGHTYIGMLITDGGQLLSCLRYDKIAKNSKIAKSDLSQNYKYLNYWNTQIIRKMQMSPKLENSKFF